MGIIEEELSSFRLSSGEDITIEYNADGNIHIHIDNIQIAFSKNEFFTLTEAIENAHNELSEIKEGYND